METVITCTVCPNGCLVTIDGEGKNIASIKGYSCSRGAEFAENEYLHPVRILTSTVKVSGCEVPLVAVRSSQPVPKNLQLACMEVLKHVTVSVPVHRYDVIVENILDTGADIVATGCVE